MRKIICITAMLALVSVWGYFVNAMQNQPAANQLLVTATASGADEMPVPRATKPPSKNIDAQRAYKANCSGCHARVTMFQQPMTAVVMHHMHLQASLTADETRALLDYLTQ